MIQRRTVGALKQIHQSRFFTPGTLLAFEHRFFLTYFAGLIFGNRFTPSKNESIPFQEQEDCVIARIKQGKSAAGFHSMVLWNSTRVGEFISVGDTQILHLFLSPPRDLNCLERYISGERAMNGAFTAHS